VTGQTQEHIITLAYFVTSRGRFTAIGSGLNAFVCRSASKLLSVEHDE